MALLQSLVPHRHLSEALATAGRLLAMGPRIEAYHCRPEDLVEQSCSPPRVQGQRVPTLLPWGLLVLSSDQDCTTLIP